MKLQSLVAGLWCALACGTGASAADAKPNLIAIVTDDQGCWAAGCYGNRDIQTPHLDSLARDGALFVNAFTATPVCSPSRATYFTGRYPSELGITDYLSPAEEAEGQGLRGQTWPSVLQRHGYRTGLFGKWHLGRRAEFHPARLGFDHFAGFLGGGNSPMNGTLEIDGKEVQTEGPLADVLTDRAIDFIRKHPSQPFAICLHFREPHLPYGPLAKVDSARYQGVDAQVPDLPGLNIQQLKRRTLDYYASISSVDRNLGRLLAVLDELGLSHNTLVTFTSDHGYNEGRHYINTKGNGNWIAGGVNGPKRPNMWDTSIRVPLLARWPAVIKPGTRIDAMVSNLDMFRSVLGALQVPLPDDCLARGIDWSPALRGESLPPREAIFGQYDLHNGGLAYLRMVRTPRFKLVRHFKARMLDEFYDLTADPDETRNIFAQPGAKAADLAALQAQLREWMESIDDPLLKATY